MAVRPATGRTVESTGNADGSALDLEKGPMPSVTPARATGRKRSGKPHSTRARLLVGAASVVGGLGLWWLIGALKLVDPLFLPSFPSTMSKVWTDLTSGSLNSDFIATGEPFLIGLAISVIGGSLIGMAMGLSRVAEEVLIPWTLGFNAVPRIAFIPMTIVAFGLSIKAHTAVVVLIGICPMILNMHAGVRHVDVELLELAKAFRASRWVTLRRVIIPSTAPFFISGFRMTVALALVGEVVAEFFSSSHGLGYRLDIASQVYDIPEVYAMMIVLAVIGIILASTIRLIERRVERWHGTQR